MLVYGILNEPKHSAVLDIAYAYCCCCNQLHSPPPREYWMNYRWPGFLAVVDSVRLLAQPLVPPSAVSLSHFLSLPVCRRSCFELTDGRGGGEKTDHTTSRKTGPL